MKTCTKCGLSKPPSDFAKDKNTRDGLNYFCRTCKAEARRRLTSRVIVKVSEKTCSCCNRFIFANCFHKHPYMIDGLSTICKDCVKKKQSQRAQREKVTVLEKVCSLCCINFKSTEYYSNVCTRDGLSSRCKKCSNAANKKSSDSSPSSKMAKILRTNTKAFLNFKHKDTSVVNKLLGCSKDQLVGYLENLFLVGMSWGNFGRGGWSIDHIIPLTAFDFSHPESFEIACSYRNLQPMWQSDNVSKGNKINWTSDEYQSPRDKLVEFGIILEI